MFGARLHDTIAAVATPPGHGGIAIIRVSGTKAFFAVSGLAKRDVSLQPSHTVKLTTLYAKNDFLDTVLLLPMVAPHSFTGEDTVEIHCHGGYAIARRILQTLFLKDVRPANPGEFSFRAYMNGKIDLVQAEAISDSIFAKNEEAQKVAGEHLLGALSKKIASFQHRATDIAAIFEAYVDFPEDEIGGFSDGDLINELEVLVAEIEALSKTFQVGKIFHQGITMCIVGSPNVGKSSLMNGLLQKNRAIVSEIPGTTRDVIEEEMMLHGVHVHLIDTAGIRDTDEVIEKEGISRSREAFARSDIVLCVLDLARSDDSIMIRPLFEVPQEKVIVVWNKKDLCEEFCVKKIIDAPHVAVSALTSEGFSELRACIEEKIFTEESYRRNETLITNLRHKEALDRAICCFYRAIDGYHQKLSPEFLSIEMREGLLHLGAIIGTDVTEDILHSIFSRFCIGK